MLTEELESIISQLARKQAEYEQLSEVHNQSLNEMEEKNQRQWALEEMIKQLQSKLKDMNSELETKTSLVFPNCLCLLGKLLV